MRPLLLDPLFASVRTLNGIGPKVCAQFSKILNLDSAQDEPRLIDLLQLMPHAIIDRRFRPKIANIKNAVLATLEVRIAQHNQPKKAKAHLPYKVIAFDDTGEIQLVFFHAKASWLLEKLPIGAHVLISGKIEIFNGHVTMVHPDYIVKISESSKLPLLEPIYPSTAGLSAKTVNRAIKEALSHLPTLPEWMDVSLKNKLDFASFTEALHRMHKPMDNNDVEMNSKTRQRLAYDELFASQLALGLIRLTNKKMAGKAKPPTGQYSNPLRNILPFRLTNGQEQAILEISNDISSKEAMLRLLQGDVGSGKTVVALMAMAQIAENLGQSALMAPTEVLAKQHFTTIKPLAQKIGLEVALLTGREKGKQRKDILANILSGKTNIIIGTHALIQDGVDYHNLSFVIIDEQHRFGVQQRLKLSNKGIMPDLLVMTATPIPRTLVLTEFGDMDVSKLTEKPIGRKPITTAILPFERIGELLQRVKAAIERGDKIYWICPLVEESEFIDLTSAQDRFIILQKYFGNMIGLVHGKMPSSEKDSAMEAFKDGTTRLLVATTVVEVGVDVPDASIIIIEHAERYGLSQLHQLRGRVGRGDKQSSCILLYKSPIGKIAKQRLNVMRETEDGFRIAEEDLLLRGEGEILGTKQSGVANFHLADLSEHGELLVTARQDARLFLEKDAELLSERGQALRILLYLFRRNEAIALLRAG